MSNNLTNQIKKWRSYRKTYNELASLTDRDLNDLGINRHDIKRVAKSSAY